MPKISEQELARLVKEAEWKGQIVTTLATIADQAVTARADASKLKEDVEDLEKNIAGLTVRLGNVEKASENSGKMSGKDRVVLYGSLIAAFSAIAVAALQYLPH